MADSPINDTFWARTLTVAAVKVLTNRHLRKIWKPRGGVLFASMFCIKIHSGESLAEAHAMQFVASNTSVPVPKIYCAFSRHGKSYIVMERMQGEVVLQGWMQRSEESRRKILDHLRSLIQELRDVNPPEEVGVANVVGGPIYDARLPGERYRGPYRNVQDFHRSLWTGIDLDDDVTGFDDLQELAKFHKDDSSRPVLTHGDLSCLNILVREDKVVGIIDWETAGWLPPYWEYARAWNVNPLFDFWQEEVDKFLTPWPRELEMEKTRSKYFGNF